MNQVMRTHLALLAGSGPQRNPVFPTERSRGMGTTFPNSTLFETFMIETLNQKPERFFEFGEEGQLPVTDTGSHRPLVA